MSRLPICVAGTGICVPTQAVASESLESSLGLEPEWIARRTGILERRIAPPGVAVRLDVETITFRPHPWHRGGRLKTEGADRTIPLWPQLREILEEYLTAYRRHLPGLALFPSPHVEADRPLTNLRDLLDRVAVRAGFLVPVLDSKTGKQARTAGGQLIWTGRRIRTRVFRQTYCAARLQTLDHGRPVSLYTVAQELGTSRRRWSGGCTLGSGRSGIGRMPQNFDRNSGLR